MVNENKALHDEMNDIYKKSSNTNDENAKIFQRYKNLQNKKNNFYKKINRLERYEKENQD
jgi:hypothetical protein